ncbi:hypothetical protein PSN45_002656 [Yamadazyma tenuis]|nr:hypothetical protein PSN45_002656 [Yamadazyma tenuis]
MNQDKVLGRTHLRSYFFGTGEEPQSFEEPTTAIDKQVESPQIHKRPRTSTSQYSSISETRSPYSSTLDPQSGHSDSDDDDDSSIYSNQEDYDPGRRTMENLLASSFNGGSASSVMSDLDNIRQYTSTGKSPREIFIENENNAISKLGRDFLKQGRRTYRKNRVTDITAYDYNLLTRLTRRYFTWMNSANQVLHEVMLHLQLDKCRNNPEKATAVDLFQVKMVIAIALASISRPHISNSEIGRIALVFWKSANKTIGSVFQGHGISKLQNILLHLQYTLLVPKTGNLWQLSGTAMRLATEMGLNGEPDPSQYFDPLSLDLRRRLFWTCYCIDRILSTSMGRPTSIHDTWISAKVPALVEDRLVTVKGIESGPMCHLKVSHIQQIRICRLQSEIYNQLYAPSKRPKITNEQLEIWSWQTYDELRLWRCTFIHPTPLITKEWFELQFHIAVVLLFRPSPNRPKLSLDALHVAFHSAGEVMRLVRIMHREYSAVFSWLTVQNLFMCGLTFANSLNELAKQTNSHQICIPFYEIFQQIQSCTAMLETLSALETGANDRIRNAFEMISSSVIQTIANIAPSLPKQSSHQGCIWAQIAKVDTITLSRPTQINGTVIPIKGQSEVLGSTNLRLWDNTSNEEAAKTHFMEHDRDASLVNSMLKKPIDSESFTIADESKASVDSNQKRNREDTVESHNSHSNHNNQDGSTRAHFHGQIHDHSTPDSRCIQGLVSSEDPQIDRVDALTIVSAQAEPLQDMSGVTNWSEVSLGAELERWFFYPLPESSERYLGRVNSPFSI